MRTHLVADAVTMVLAHTEVMERDLLLAEQLALVAIREDSGRHEPGTRSRLNACLAGLLVAELALEGHAQPGDRPDTFIGADGQPPTSPMLAAAARVLADKGPRIKAVLSHMDRGLSQEIGLGTWDAAVGGLVDAGVVTSGQGRLRPRHELIDQHRRDVLVARLRAAAAGDHPLEPRTALLLAMAGPAYLLQVVAPERGTRRHARDRINHVLEGTPFEPIRKAVRKVIAEAEAAASVASMAATAG